MSELIFSPVLPEITTTFKGGEFSTMYYGSHCGKNVLILQHDFTIMVVFGDDRRRSTPDFVKTVSFRGNRRKVTKVVGNENIVLLLDEDGKLWKLINAFEVSVKEEECLHSLNQECFYEWVPFSNFNFEKVLAFTATGSGFACLGLSQNSEKKLLLLSLLGSAVGDFTFEELNVTSSLSFYLTSFNMNNEETLLVTDRLSGKTYLGTKNKRTSLINVSNIFLISVLHFHQRECLLLCFENGKLIFYFYNKSQRQCVAYLMKKLVFINQCCCSDSCLLWSEGIYLNHTKFQAGEDLVKLDHLKMNCHVQCPLFILKIHEQNLVVTINNFYYLISPGSGSAEKVIKQPEELLSEICNGSNIIEELEEKNELLAYYLTCKELVQNDKVKKKAEIRWEGNFLSVKSCLKIPLREDFWRVRLMKSELNKGLVVMTDLEADLSQGGYFTIENPFKKKCRLNVSLLGSFEDQELFLDLGEVEVDEVETDKEKDELCEGLKAILQKRNPFYLKETKKVEQSFWF